MTSAITRKRGLAFKSRLFVSSVSCQSLYFDNDNEGDVPGMHSQQGRHTERQSAALELATVLVRTVNALTLRLELRDENKLGAFWALLERPVVVYRTDATSRYLDLGSRQA